MVAGHLFKIQNTVKSSQILPVWKVSRSTLLVIATLLWISVGVMLLVKGWGWQETGYEWVVIVLGLLFGVLKSVLFLDKSFARSIDRIKQFHKHEEIIIVNVFSAKTWLLIGLMIIFGLTMRGLTSPCPAIGVLYVSIGWGMLLSSRHGWRASVAMHRGDHGSG
jgi:hypothetical protein